MLQCLTLKECGNRTKPKSSNEDDVNLYAPKADKREQQREQQPEQQRDKILIVHNITRISDIDTSGESFRAKFTLILTWPASAKDVLDHKKKFKKSRELFLEEGDKPGDLQWTPLVTFPNAIDVHSQKWRSIFPAERKKAFTMYYSTEDDAYLVKAKLECDITFFEDFELENLPFDCQDLTIKIECRDGRGEPYDFEPGSWKVLNAYLPFATIKTDLSPITDTWELVGMAIEFFIERFDDGERCFTRNKTQSSPRCVLSIKLARKWGVVVRNELLVILMLAALSMSVFAVEVDDFTDRVAQSLTLLLTTVLYDTRTPTKSYSTLMDTYQLCIYAFMFSIMVANLLEYIYEWDSAGHRRAYAQNFGVALLVLHFYFFGLSAFAYFWEHKKVEMGYRAVKSYLKGHGARPKFRAFPATVADKDGNVELRVDDKPILAKPFTSITDGDDAAGDKNEADPGCYDCVECVEFVESWLHCIRFLDGLGLCCICCGKALKSCCARCGVSCSKRKRKGYEPVGRELKVGGAKSKAKEAVPSATMPEKGKPKESKTASIGEMRDTSEPLSTASIGGDTDLKLTVISDATQAKNNALADNAENNGAEDEKYRDEADESDESEDVNVDVSVIEEEEPVQESSGADRGSETNSTVPEEVRRSADVSVSSTPAKPSAKPDISRQSRSSTKQGDVMGVESDVKSVD